MSAPPPPRIIYALPDDPGDVRAWARAIVAPMLARVWVEQGQLVAITPTAAFRPLFVALWNAYEVTMGCPTGFEPPLLTPLWDDARTRLAA